MGNLPHIKYFPCKDVLIPSALLLLPVQHWTLWTKHIPTFVTPCLTPFSLSVGSKWRKFVKSTLLSKKTWQFETYTVLTLEVSRCVQIEKKTCPCEFNAVVRHFIPQASSSHDTHTNTVPPELLTHNSARTLARQDPNRFLYPWGN